MIQGRLIVCIASSWEYDPTSKHHIMRILSRHNDVLWINYHGSRKPGVNRTDLRDSVAALRRVLRGLTPVHPTFSHLTPLVIPGASSPRLRRWNQWLVTLQIRRALHRARRRPDQPVQIWSFAPDVPFLIDAVPAERCVYYCVDNFAQFEGYDADRIRGMENETLEKAEVVLVSSEALLRDKSRRRRDVVLMRHGVEYDHFAAAWRASLPIPSDLAAIPRPIFGYHGLLHHWVDLPFLAEVARLRPFYSFVLLGDAKVDTSPLQSLNNVYLLGRKSYIGLPAYAAGFDAALMLFKRDAMSAYVNPIKLHEYLAAGLRVVSTELPEARRYEGAVLFADGPREFAEACDRVLEEAPNTTRESLSRLVRDEDWALKVEQLSDIVMSMGGRTLASAQRSTSSVWPKTLAREPVWVR